MAGVQATRPMPRKLPQFLRDSELGARTTGIEPAASASTGQRSTAELRPQVAPERLELSCPFQAPQSECGASTSFRHGAVRCSEGTSRELPERVRVESNHRARLRRASLYSPELRTLRCRTGVEPDPGETGRARTGTYPGHNRALCPVKLRPPRLPVKVHTVSSSAPLLVAVISIRFAGPILELPPQ